MVRRRQFPALSPTTTAVVVAVAALANIVHSSSTRAPPVCNVLDHGAKGDNATEDTAAVASALRACVGGTVVLPAGHTFLCVSYFCCAMSVRAQSYVCPSACRACLWRLTFEPRALLTFTPPTRTTPTRTTLTTVEPAASGAFVQHAPPD
jgi:hypothetical protein